MHANFLLAFTVILWGIWGWADKNAVARAHPFTVQWMYSAPYVVFLPLWYALGSKSAPVGNLNLEAFLWSVSAGIASMTAMILLFFALQSKPASIAISITSAYPMITLLLSVMWGMESFSISKIVGIVLISGGVTLLQIR